MSEFLTLADGRRVALHQDRGFTIGLGSRNHGREELRNQETVESITRQVLNTVLPDDDEAAAEPHPWSWLAELARARGLVVTADDLRALPYEVRLSQAVREWLTPREATDEGARDAPR